MLKPTDSASFNDTEQAILEAALQNPDMTNAEIAAETGARVSLVRDVREEHEDEVELPEDDGYDDSGGGGGVDTDADLSPVQQAILDVAADNPDATNADIADETGARLPLVRDTLATHGDAVDATGGGSGGSSGSSGGASGAAGGDLSDGQQDILEYAADNPEATNADIADAVGARLPTVRDTLAEHGDGGGAGGTAGGSGGGASGGDSDLQSEIVELAEANPEMTNAEIADEVGARVTLVRDTLADNEYSSSEVETAGDGELPAGVDASVLNDTEQAILELAQGDEELTNAEIAAQTGTTVAIVRDTRVKYEPDKSADYGGEGTIEEDDDDDEETTTTTDTSREWTPGDPTELQEEVLQTALENEELTNAEIAEETGARLPLVRDTLADYDDLTLADLEGGVSSSYEPDEPSSWDDLTATQQAILDAAEENPEATNAEIAEEVGARLPTVRDTRRNYEDGIGTDEESASSESAESTAAAADADDDVSAGRLIALAIILLVIIIAAIVLGGS
ncbi:MAG: hypothetical protein ABEH60_05600 [Halonotius sp.]